MLVVHFLQNKKSLNYIFLLQFALDQQFHVKSAFGTMTNLCCGEKKSVNEL
jgi:hypothetical protein